MKIKIFAQIICCAATLSAGPWAHAGGVDSEFKQRFSQQFLSEYWRLNPDAAIDVGYYAAADRLVVPDAQSRAAQLAFLEKWQRILHHYDPAKLDVNNRTDWAILDNELNYERWQLNELRAWQWNPATYNVADAFALILTTDYAPLESRLRSVLKRLARVPQYYQAAEFSIEHPTREHTQLAIQQNLGALNVFGAQLDQQVSGAHLDAAERRLLAMRIVAARAAIQGYLDWLQALNAKLASGARSWRIGKTLYDQEFDYATQSGETAESLYQRARQEKERLLNRMSLLADELWPKYFPNASRPDDRLQKIAAIIDKLSEQHTPRAKYLDTVRELVPELTRWVADHHLIEMDASKPLRVRITPEYKQGVAGASCDLPGPYDQAAPTFFNVTPLEKLSPEAAESTLREYNRWMLPILVIHEAIPGHYVQGVYANRSASLVKSVFGNNAMIEGWAVYSERMMIESGYGDDTAEMWLIYSKWNLRSVINTILDYSLHVLNMSEADARTLLSHEGFQSQAEVDEKWLRATRTSVQLTSYFAGYSAIYGMRERRKKELGERFDLQRFHEEFLSYGNAPIGLIEQNMQLKSE